jgi:hypothetical protein
MIGLAFAATLAASGAQLPEPIAPAQTGQVQCYQPDAARKTCRSIGAYEPRAGGAIANTAWVLVNDNPAIVMKTVAPVEIKEGRTCGRLTADLVDASTFTLAGAEIDAARTEQYRGVVKQMLGPMIGREVCVGYVADGAGLMGQGFVDGVRMPAMDQRVVWLPPGHGYRVAP